ncbi:MAG: amidase family protein [Arenicellales bacterium]
MSSDELSGLFATELSARLRSGALSPLEVMDATISRIEAVNPKVNALPILCLDRARKQARAMTEQRISADAKGPLWGLPLAVKDYNDLGGVATTYGSPLFADNIAHNSDATVAKLQASGAIAVGKSNVPEWAGAHTFNPVFGHTLNPWNSAVSAGGSSGGSGVALATGMVPLATGNDLGGSLRVPASFNGVVGLRPGPGRVPRGARLPAFDTLWVEGPMGRCVADVALMLDGAVGHDPVDPLSFQHAGESFVDALQHTDMPRRVGFSPDLGVVPMEPEVAQVCEAAAERFSEIGAQVDRNAPDFSGAIEAFQTLRGVLIAQMMESILQQHRQRIAPEIIWNIEKGLAVTNAQLLDAERVRSRLYRRMEDFFKDYDLLLCPTVSVPPFPKDQRYVEVIAGQPTQTYIDWIAITFAITMTSCPALSLPVGFTETGLPVGLQVIGPPRGEAALLAACHRMEEALGLASQVPIDPILPGTSIGE